MPTHLSMMGMLKNSDGWDDMKNVTIDGQRAVRHRVILRPEHKGMRLSSSLGHVEKADIGRELVVDVYEDGNIIDVIADAPKRAKERAKDDAKFYTVRRTERVIRGSYRAVDTYKFTGSEEDYDRFLDLRTDLGGELRRGKNMPTVRIDGHQQYSSFEVVDPT